MLRGRSAVVWLALCGCGPQGLASGGESESGSETGPSTETGESETSCEIAEPALQLRVSVDGDAATQPYEDCIVTQASKEGSTWTLETDCTTALIEAEFTTSPALEKPPALVGEVVQVLAGADPEAEHAVFELLGPDQLRLALRQLRGSVLAAPEQPSFDAIGPETRFIFAWSPRPECARVEASCGASSQPVAQLGLEASLGSQLSLLGPQLRHSTFGGEGQNGHYGIWIGDAWEGECAGQPSRSLSYAVARLP